MEKKADFEELLGEYEGILRQLKESGDDSQFWKKYQDVTHDVNWLDYRGGEVKVDKLMELLSAVKELQRLDFGDHERPMRMLYNGVNSIVERERELVTKATSEIKSIRRMYIDQETEERLIKNEDLLRRYATALDQLSEAVNNE